MGGQTTNSNSTTNSSGSSTATQTTTPPPWVAPQLTGIPGIAAALFGSNPNTALTPQTTAGINLGTGIANSGVGGNMGNVLQQFFTSLTGNGGMTQGQQGAMSSLASFLGGAPAPNLNGPASINAANAVNSLQYNNPLNALTNQLQPYTSGSLIGNNPYLSNILANTDQNIQSRLDSQYSGAGRYGSAPHDIAVANAIANNDNTARMADMNQQQTNQINAAGLVNNANTANNSQLISAINGQGALGAQNNSSFLSALGSLFGMGQNGISNATTAAGLQPGLNSGLYNDSNSLLSLGNAAAGVNSGAYSTLANFVNLLRGASNGYGTTNSSGTSQGTQNTQGSTTSSQSPFSQIAGGGTALAGLAGGGKGAAGGSALTSGADLGALLAL